MPDVVIVGGGVIGASIAYHLASRGVRDVLVLERDSLGSGSTSRNAGGIRLQFSSETNVRLSQRSLPRFERFEEEMGVDPQFHQVGYLFLITAERDVAAFERSLETWRRIGVPARRVERDRIRDIFPELVVDDVRFATFCPRDGHADPTSVLNGYVSRARGLGVRFRERAPVSGISCERSRVTGVRVGDETISCGQLVDAAGPWAAQVAAMAGVDVPISPLRRHIFVTEPVAGFTREFPLTIEFATSLYMHRESGGVLLGMGDADDGPGFDDAVNWEFMPQVVERALARLPLLERTAIRSGWAGFYEDTPDKHPILGPVDEVAGLFLAAGFSGHGFMHAPAAGEVVADLVLGREPALGVSALNLRRFRTGELVKEHNVI